MLIIKNGFFIMAAEDKDGDIFFTCPGSMAQWMTDNWEDAAIWKSEVIEGWIESIVTPEEWKQALEQLGKMDQIISPERPFVYPDIEVLRHLEDWAVLCSKL
jgi:hypothetical protein